MNNEIKSDKEYKKVLKTIDKWMNTAVNKEIEDKMMELVSLIETYESIHCPMPCDANYGKNDKCPCGKKNSENVSYTRCWCGQWFCSKEHALENGYDFIGDSYEVQHVSCKYCILKHDEEKCDFCQLYKYKHRRILELKTKGILE
jgi:hypothetical protein